MNFKVSILLAKTLAQLHKELSLIKECLTDKIKVPAISSACELYMRFISLKDFDHHVFFVISYFILNRIL